MLPLSGSMAVGEQRDDYTLDFVVFEMSKNNSNNNKKKKWLDS